MLDYKKLASSRQGILSAVGKTPLIKLSRLFGACRFEVYAKLEGLNPGGSSKDRPALAMLEAAVVSGEVVPGTTIIESSSGNMGIGLAQFCAFHGLDLICVVDSKTTLQNRLILEAYGARIDVVMQPDPVTGELLTARLKRVQELVEQHQPAFWPDQYGNRHNAGAHHRTTMTEICEALDGRVDYLFCAASTCGTLRGCLEHVQEHGLPTQLIAVDAIGSLIFASEASPRWIPGLGAGLRPPLCPDDVHCLPVHVSDLDCVAGCRRLVRYEGILAGGSSGGVVSAVERLAPSIRAGSTCAVILSDRGERYLDSVYSDAWVLDRLGAEDFAELGRRVGRKL
jgi:cysteine synthase A